MPADHAGAEQYALYRQKAAEAVDWLSLQPEGRYLPADSLSSFFAEPLTPLFADEYDPFSLAAVNRQLGLQSLLFCSLYLEAGAEYLRIDAFGFPDGIFTERIQIRLSDSPEWKWDRIFARSFKPLLQLWQKTDPVWRQPFPPDVNGLVVLTDALDDSLYLRHCRTFISRLPVDESKKPLRLKVLDRSVALSTPEVYPNGFALIDRTAAEYLFYLQEKNSALNAVLLVPPDSLYRRHVCDWQLPMLPAIPQLTRLQMTADSLMLQIAGRVFFYPPQDTRGLELTLNLPADRFA
ncbi:hypothetical protein JXO59_10265, partial [candidate division KSB1 bacterium]|nr:hypothetical protein [candidate division KSB1 bacterium]